MIKEIKITIENRLILEKRAVNVYHHASRSTHMISHNSSVTLPLRTKVEQDYLHISIVIGPGALELESIANLPSWIDFEFLFDRDVALSHLGERTLLKISPGLPVWQLKLTWFPFQHKHSADLVTIGDEQLE